MKYIKKFENAYIDDDENKYELGPVLYKFKVGDIVTIEYLTSLEEIVEYMEKTAGEISACFVSKSNVKSYRIKYFYNSIPEDIKKHFIHLKSDDGEFFFVNIREKILRYSTDLEREEYLTIRDSKKYNL